MIIMAIDPGTTQSAYVELGGINSGHDPDAYHTIFDHELLPNDEILQKIFEAQFSAGELHIVCEQVESFGMAVGKEVFQTVHWCGRFHQKAEQHNVPFEMVPRRTIKTYWCKSARATDANIWQAMTDFWGPPGTKKEPGKLYGIKSHQRAALAIAGWKLDVLKERQNEIITANR